MSSAIRSSGSFSLDEHPLLRLARDDPETSGKFKRFNRVLRASLRSSASSEERASKAREVLSQLDELRLGEESLAAFRLEWLREMAAEVSDPVILEKLALAELEDADVCVQPPGWIQSERSGPELPHLSRKSDLVVGDDVRAAVKAWDRIVETAVSAVTDQSIANWDKEECLAACRAMILSTVSAKPTRLKGVSGQLLFMEGVGAAIWRNLSTKLTECGEKGPSSTQPIWSEDMHARLVLHLRGLMAAIVVGSSNERVSSRDSDRGDASEGGSLIVVTEPIPPSTEKTDKEALKQYEVLRRPLPLAPMPQRGDLQGIFAQLTIEFPWATAAIAQLEDVLWPGCLLGVKSVRIRPVLLVGKPGAGKSRLARRVSELLRLPYMPIACGGTGDSKLLTGTARGWASGEPTPIIGLLLRRRLASAFVLLDEIDKAISNHYSSPPLPSVLLGLLEPETARRWRDGYLQASCDLSGVTFWATANTLSTIPRPLLSRFEIVHVPEPGAEHLQSLADSITSELEREWNVPEGTLPRLRARHFACGQANARELRSAIQRELAKVLRESLRPERLH